MYDTNEPLVSIIIPTYNRPAETVVAIKSVFSQTYENIEVIVIDDGSSETFKEILLHEITDLHDQRVKTYYFENEGVGAARNRGVERAGGEYIAFLDSDDRYTETSIEDRLNFLLQNPEFKVIYADQIVEADGIIQHTRFEKNSPKSKMSLPGYVDHTPIHADSVMLHKSVLNEVGFFRPELKIHEDSEFWNRISLKYSFGIIEKPLSVFTYRSNVNHLMSSNNKQIKNETGRLYLKFFEENCIISHGFLTNEEKQGIADSLKIINDDK